MNSLKLILDFPLNVFCWICGMEKAWKKNCLIVHSGAKILLFCSQPDSRFSFLFILIANKNIQSTHIREFCWTVLGNTNKNPSCFWFRYTGFVIELPREAFIEWVHLESNRHVRRGNVKYTLYKLLSWHAIECSLWQIFCFSFFIQDYFKIFCVFKTKPIQYKIHVQDFVYLSKQKPPALFYFNFFKTWWT